MIKIFSRLNGSYYFQNQQDYDQLGAMLLGCNNTPADLIRILRRKIKIPLLEGDLRLNGHTLTYRQGRIDIHVVLNSVLITLNNSINYWGSSLVSKKIECKKRTIFMSRNSIVLQDLSGTRIVIRTPEQALDFNKIDIRSLESLDFNLLLETNPNTLLGKKVKIVYYQAADINKFYDNGKVIYGKEAEYAFQKYESNIRIQQMFEEIVFKF